MAEKKIVKSWQEEPCKCCRPAPDSDEKIDPRDRRDDTQYCDYCRRDFCRDAEHPSYGFSVVTTPEGENICLDCLVKEGGWKLILKRVPDEERERTIRHYRSAEREALIGPPPGPVIVPKKSNPGKTVQIMVPPHIARRSTLLAREHCAQKGIDPDSGKGKAMVARYQHDFCLQWTESQTPDLDEDLAAIESRQNPHTPHTAISIRNHFPALYGPGGLVDKMAQGDAAKKKTAERNFTTPTQTIANIYLENVARKKRQGKAYPENADEAVRRKSIIARYVSLVITAAVVEGVARSLAPLPKTFSELASGEEQTYKKTKHRSRSLNPKAVFGELFGPGGLVDKIAVGDKVKLANTLSGALTIIANSYVKNITRYEPGAAKSLPFGAVKESLTTKARLSALATNAVIRAMVPAMLEVFSVKPEKFEQYVENETKDKTASELNTKEFRDGFLDDLTRYMRGASAPTA